MLTIEPILSLSTFLIIVIAALVLTRTIVEVIEIRKAREDYGRCSPRTVPHPAGERQRLSPSQKSIQRYYSKYSRGA